MHDHASNGWLLPDGNFVECLEHGHIDIVINLADPYGREPPCWVKLAAGKWIVPSCSYSQAQIDYIWDWSQARKAPLPKWLRAHLGIARNLRP